MPSLQNLTIKNKHYYKLIYDYKCNGGVINIKYCLNYLKLNESGYYRYVKSLQSKKTKEDLRILADIQYLMKKHNNRLGYRQIKMKLDEAYRSYNFKVINHKRIQRIMKDNDIKCTIRRKNPYRNIWKATDTDKISKNILNREFKNGKPGEKLLTDITYLHYKNGRAYLSAIKDSVTGEIISYVVKDNLGIELSIEVISNLESKYKTNKTLIHSDQGVHYTSPVYRDKLKSFGIVQSMSRRGNCLNNAPMESFFGHLKDECNIQKARNVKELQEEIEKYMIYYNTRRRQWSKKKMTPIEYRNHLLNISV